MVRSLVGGFLGALLALAVAGAAVAVIGQRDGLPGADSQHRTVLLNQIDDLDHWLAQDRYGQLYAETHARGVGTFDDYFRRFLAWHPELAAYMAWLHEARWREFCTSGVTPICQIQAAEWSLPGLRDPRRLDAYLAARR